LIFRRWNFCPSAENARINSAGNPLFSYARDKSGMTPRRDPDRESSEFNQFYELGCNEIPAFVTTSIGSIADQAIAKPRLTVDS